MKKGTPLTALLRAGLVILILSCCSTIPLGSSCGSGSGRVLDEAKCVGRTAESLPGANEDYFREMDYGATKDPAQVAAALFPYVPGITSEQAVSAAVLGRNNWIVWTGGNDRLWDNLSVQSAGILDFLKILSNHPSIKQYSRDNRWHYLGLVNEPCFDKGTGPRNDRFGLWLDTRSADCPADPFENETKYPGVRIGARGNSVPVGSYYGYATGIVGLRLFPNPDFDEAAAKRWDPERYYTDETYYNDKKLVKPYRVGMSCGFCHVGPNPSNPPKDPEHPKWENLNSNPGAQYFWVDRIFVWQRDPTSFAYQLFHTSRPGALDTSFVSTDYINNPRSMNSLYNFGARMELALKAGQEQLAGGELNNEQLNKYVSSGPLTQFYRPPSTVWTTRVLKDGSDSVGPLGALNRVYVNIGLFSEEWLEHFKPFVGGRKFTPFEIAVADKNSSYWKATEAQSGNVALFFLATTKPDLLKNAPGGAAYLTAGRSELDRGKTMFAERCARCHSSKLPEQAFRFFQPEACRGSGYLNCWNAYWQWTRGGEFKSAMTKIALADDFQADNYFSTELRVPITLLETNACSSLATNALAGDIWDNFSSTTYKNLPSVGNITVHHPLTGAPRQYPMPAGGRGYIRPPSLISLWSSAPFLLNNSLGDFYPSGSVEDRMKSFDSGIEQLLWPEKRGQDPIYATASGKKLPGRIDVTPEKTYLRVPKGYLPDFLQPLVGPLSTLKPWLFSEGGIELGPIPKGTPINLISNIDLEQREKVFDVIARSILVLKSLPRDASDEEAQKAFAPLVEPLLGVSKCPDFVVNRGHYFGTEYFSEEPGLSDQDKRALIAFLKTL
ncbi:MAG TPA: hypothetical protein VGK44_01210 [Casimicrobiaceae bacterium]